MRAELTALDVGGRKFTILNTLLDLSIPLGATEDGIREGECRFSHALGLLCPPQLLQAALGRCWVRFFPARGVASTVEASCALFTGLFTCLSHIVNIEFVGGEHRAASATKDHTRGDVPTVIGFAARLEGGLDKIW